MANENEELLIEQLSQLLVTCPEMVKIDFASHAIQKAYQKEFGSIITMAQIERILLRAINEDHSIQVAFRPNPPARPSFIGIEQVFEIRVVYKPKPKLVEEEPHPLPCLSPRDISEGWYPWDEDHTSERS